VGPGTGKTIVIAELPVPVSRLRHAAIAWTMAHLRAGRAFHQNTRPAYLN
jgi:hypothetical protein